MSDSTTHAAAKLKQLISKCSDTNILSGNEAKTRLLLVDEVLTHVLGWSTEDFNPETYAKEINEEGKPTKQWLDYHLKRGQTLRLVVEAKRIGTTFSLSSKKQKPRSVPLQTLMEHHGKELRAALRQARTYCTSVGTYAFVVTNGVQWIASLAFAQNVEQSKFQARVFYDLQDVYDHLDEFRNLLSPEGMASQNMLSLCLGSELKRPSFARSLNDELGIQVARETNRNYLAPQLTSLMTLCFGDLTDADHADMLDSCYVGSEAIDEDLRRMELFVGNNLPQAIPAHAEKVDRRYLSSKAPVFENGGVSFVVGRAGSGKSTFLALAKRQLQRSGLAERRVLLHADLIGRTENQAEKFDHDKLIRDVCSDLLVQAHEHYKGRDPYDYELLLEIFKGEIGRLRSATPPSERDSAATNQRINELIQRHISEPDKHLKAYLGYLARRDSPAIIMLDNVDRGTKTFEHVTVQLARLLAQNTNASVLVTLRDTTYESGRTGGFLDVSRHSVFTIGPPPFGEVVKRRFDYASQRLQTDSRLGAKFARSLRGVPYERVMDFASIIADMVLGGDGGLHRSIQALAGANIRVALEYLEIFAESPHTDLNRLFNIYRQYEQNSNRIAEATTQSFLRSVMRARWIRYSEPQSKVVNLFQASKDVLQSHLIALRVLQLLRWHGASAGGYRDMEVTDLLGHLGSLGHDASVILRVLEHLGRHRLVVSLSKLEPPWDLKADVRLGIAGSYYIETIVQEREYLQNVADDVVIYDERVLHSMKLITTNSQVQWRDRINERTRIFLLYLAREEAEELSTVGAKSLRPPWLTPIVEPIGIRHFGQDFRQAIRSRRSRTPARGTARPAGSGKRPNPRGSR